ncbi:MAG: dTDP-4-dehydrorhamnose reductase [Pseudomonadota bacterium]
MSILVTGAGGQLGRELAQRLPAAEACCLARAELDLTDAAALSATLAHLRPQVVINAAAYTDVDRAETEPEAAFAANADAPGLLARACAEAGAALLHVSTDYVFNGQSRRPWREDDPTGPINVYGASKLAGEQAILSALPRHIIVRTAWVFGAHGPNFVRTVLRLARERGALRIVADQTGSPTWAGHLAETLIALARRIAAGASLPWGVYHYAGAPASSWHAFAQAIVAEATAQGLLPAAVPVEPIDSAAYPTPARRPAWSVLDGGKMNATFSLAAPDWRVGLDQTLRALKRQEEAA